MENFNSKLTRAVIDFMAFHDINQSVLAKSLSLTQPGVSERLSGRRHWRLRDIVNLAQFGVEVPPFTVEEGGRDGL